MKELKNRWKSESPEFWEKVGRIGVGITTPNALFHINNSNSDDSFLVEDETNPDASPFIIKSDGKVGLGTTDPVAKLDIISPATAGDSETLLKLRVNDDLNSGLSIYNATGADNIFIPTLLGENSSDKTALYFIGKGTNDTGNLPIISLDARIGFNNPVATRPAFSFSNYGTSLLHIAANGNVGIGVTNPGYKLDVAGEIAIRGGQAADDARMYFQASDNSNRFTIETNFDDLPSLDIFSFRATNFDNILTLGGNGNISINAAPTDESKLYVSAAGLEQYAGYFLNNAGGVENYAYPAYGIYAKSTNSLGSAYGAEFEALSTNLFGSIAIGAIMRAFNGSNNYSLQLLDSTQTVGGGKFLRDMGDGKANWATLSVASTGLTITTTGSSGPATLVGNTLNIPQYSGGGGSVDQNIINASNMVLMYNS
jgi:hypothetical protein